MILKQESRRKFFINKKALNNLIQNVTTTSGEAKIDVINEGGSDISNRLKVPSLEQQ
jgi:hypothetical protein